jgi:hypothetical protein
VPVKCVKNLCAHKLITPWKRILLDKLTGTETLKKYLASYETWACFPSPEPGESASWSPSYLCFRIFAWNFDKFLIRCIHTTLGLSSSVVWSVPFLNGSNHYSLLIHLLMLDTELMDQLIPTAFGKVGRSLWDTDGACWHFFMMHIPTEYISYRWYHEIREKFPVASFSERETVYSYVYGKV